MPPSHSRLAAAGGLSSCLVTLLLAAAAASAQTGGECTPAAAAKRAPATTADAAGALERGNRLAARGDDAAALDAFAESERLARRDSDPALRVLASASAARSAAALGRDEGLGDRVEALLEASSQLEPAALRAHVLLHVGRTLVLMNQRTRAAEVLMQAADAARLAPDWRLHSYALGHLAELYAQDGRDDDALSLTRRALASGQIAQAPDAIYRWQWQIGRIRLSQGDPAAALDAYRLAIETLREARELTSSGVQPLYEGLVDLLLARADQGDEASRQALLREARNALEDLTASELRDYFRDACLDAQRKAAPDTVPGTLVVYPIPLEERLVLISSFEGRLDSHVVPVTRPVLVHEIRRLRATLEKRTTFQYRKHAQRLYDWLIGPLEPVLRSGGVETIVFVPRGALHTIPPAALLDRRTGRFLIERVPLAVVPGLSLTEPRAIDREQVTLLAVGVGDAVQGYPALRFVPQELSEVSEIFPGRRLLNRAFVAGGLEQELTREPFDIVHVASHGEFAADVSESYLLTYDGRISMDELSRLVGTTRFRERGLELLTLSACETAAGDDRAALGLAGVALSAGARSALATLWAVNDAVAAELIVTFYRQLADPSHTRAQALQQAQLSVLRTGSHRHPGYWAPYLLISSWL